MYLAVNATDSHVQVVLAAGQRGMLYGEERFGQGRAMAFVGVMTQRVLDVAGVKPHDLHGVAVVVGPGSFTGIRITASFVYGLAKSTELPTASVSSLELWAEEVSSGLSRQGKTWVAIQARQGQSIVQCFELGPKPRPLTIPRLMKCSELETILQGRMDSGEFCLAGTAVKASDENFFRGHIYGRNRTSLRSLATMALRAGYGDEDLTMFYGRPADAELCRKVIEFGRGI
ncbi:MAG: tRNA (adenosine(37)-N6)-threonylcarbamoyltransferase complex dimerization subunit type 1 TsaB [Deltaproteobacteria bacterium]|nr:tRNA (adenosine(37)-N6)-threonylcarbamoyltransferase complex dimerization subunit type 1 TsaB [Deltaproteobacteria bacterium]